jgi:hypothetical protein
VAQIPASSATASNQPDSPTTLDIQCLDIAHSGDPSRPYLQPEKYLDSNNLRDLSDPPVNTPIPARTKNHAIRRWRAHIPRPPGTPEPDDSWRNECPCGNLASCPDHPELKTRVRYYRPQHPDYLEGLQEFGIPFYKPTAEEIGCTQEALDRSCDFFAENPRMKDPPDPRFAPKWLKSEY